MKTRYFYTLQFILLLTILCSCEEMVSDVDAPTSQEKLVVTGFITPGLPQISVKVYKSRPLFTTNEYNGEYPVVDDAIVTISTGNNSVNLIFDNESGSYRNAMEILRGETYYLEVKQGNFLVHAQCTVPTLSPPDLEIVSIDSVTEYNELYYHATLRFKDTTGQGQYYHLSAASVYPGESGSIPSIYEVPFSRGDPFVTDKNKDGNYFTYTTDNIYKYPDEPLRLVFTIGTTDENYYLYHKALHNFEDDNPFSEPSPIYSNVNGGLGIFAAYIQKVIVVEY